MVLHRACQRMHARLNTICQRLNTARLNTRRRQRRWRGGQRRCLGAQGSALVFAIVVILGGCGEVHFIPSPYTPEAVEAVFSVQEQVTVIRWRLGAAAPAADTQFELLGPNGYQPIDFSRSVFPSGVAACADGAGACAQFVVRGQAAIAQGDHPIRAVHPTYGVLPGGPAAVRTLSTTLSLQSYFHFKNDRVFVSFMDELANDGPYAFPRSYDSAMWPTSGLCVSDVAPEGVRFEALNDDGGFAPREELSESGIYCVASRPIPHDGGGAAMVQTRVATVPEVETRVQNFDPPVEQAPVIYQIVLDLEIPVPDRCAAAVQTIETLVDSTFGRAPVPVRKLPTLNLAQTDGGSPCAQTDGRSLAAADMADAVKKQVIAFPEVHQQFHFLYFNNLDSPLPRTLTDSMHALFDALGSPPGYDLMPLWWMFNPGAAAASDLSWWRTSTWIAADDPQFGQALTDYAENTLPYESQLHDPGDPVAFLSPEETPNYAGGFIKICQSSPSVQPLWSLKNPTPVFDPSWAIDGESSPAYLVYLQPEIAVQATSFVDQSAIVHYQLCTRYCADHPYLTDAGQGAKSWATDTRCASPEY